MLKLVRIKPNPSGKDRPRFGSPSPAQLGAEWIDIQNIGGQAIDLNGVELHHAAYGPGCSNPRWEQVIVLRGSLGAGKTVRVHAGENRPPSVLHLEDFLGADHHVFTGSDRYVWNNTCGDTAGLFCNSIKLDQASYSPNPPEGQVLVRQGDRFVLAGASILRSPGW